MYILGFSCLWNVHFIYAICEFNVVRTKTGHVLCFWMLDLNLGDHLECTCTNVASNRKFSLFTV
jgi:hypothetical protein